VQSFENWRAERKKPAATKVISQAGP
jgi:hypothetical protein